MQFLRAAHLPCTLALSAAVLAGPVAAQNKPGLRTLGTPARIGGKGILDAAFSPDGKLIATANENGTVDLWNAHDGSRARHIEADRHGITGVAFARRGTRLVTVTRRHLRVWSTARPDKPVHDFKIGDVDGSPRVAVDDAGRRIVCTEPRAGKLSIFDFDRGSRLRTVPFRAKVIYRVVLSAGKQVLAIGREPHLLLGCDLDGEPREVALESAPHTLALAPDNTILAVSLGKKVMLFRLPSLAVEKTLQPLDDAIQTLAFGADGASLFAGGQHGTLARIDLTTGKCTWQHTRSAQAVRRVVASPDGKLIASSGGNGEGLRFWRAETGAETHDQGGHEGEVDSLSFSPDGKSLVSGARDGSTILWEVRTGKLLRRVRASDGPIRGVGWAGNPKGRVWVAPQHGPLRYFDPGREPTPIETPKGKLRRFVVAPDGSSALTAFAESKLLLWQLPAGTSTALPVDADPRHVVIAPSGRIAAAGGEGGFWVFDLRGAKPMATAVPYRGKQLEALALLDDKRLLCVGAGQSIVRQFDPATGRLVDKFEIGDHPIRALASGPDGRVLAVATPSALRIHETRRFKLLKQLKVRGGVRTLAFDRKGVLLALGMADYTVRLVDIRRLP
ncbi:MAG: hypothetical protein KDC87_07020 [Planctomycetes bacterium]|nr:hypothetical protein [Planctomycetota bacterium]MCB9872040.1 hypothetical protein [Planctomycetota bacterium]MCB9888442.1 hypothetical protein [Planctomycetota bacterium]